ncbi:hypothetical protein ACFWAY_47140 [Rhodococcus sp. NPDC059968]|uniref:hypothetical protein n=1 Tax=Rhodococcus sp. NPDC059968 TaxID=3347017 RepID=UPI0036731B77
MHLDAAAGGGGAWRRHSTTSPPSSPTAPIRNRPAPGEQLALHIVAVTAGGRHLDGDLDGDLDDLLHEVPAHPDDIDWISPLDFLFEDYDVLTLFDPEPVDGVNLDAVDWFVPFEDHRARNPHRRYRC